jgi:hypothetical protein
VVYLESNGPILIDPEGPREMWSNVLTVALGATIPVSLGIVSFILQQRWTRRENLRQLRQVKVLDYLTNAYSALTAIEPAGGVGHLTIEEKQNLETAFRDAYLYGDDGVVAALKEFMERFKTSKGQEGSIDKLLEAMRSQLRRILSLQEITQSGTPSISTGWRYDAALAKAQTGVLTEANVELMTTEEAMSLTSLDLNELLEYAKAGSLAQPVQIDGSLRWFASAVRGLRDDLKRHASP